MNVLVANPLYWKFSGVFFAACFYSLSEFLGRKLKAKLSFVIEFWHSLGAGDGVSDVP